MTDVVAPSGRRIALRSWRAWEPRAVVQVLHGLAEHIDRYERFATACNRRGIAVVGHDHRGHGAAAEATQLGHFGDKDGWSRVIDDAYAVFRATEREYRDLPIILLGHSMGSYIAQDLVMRKTPAIAGLLLSGSTWPKRSDVRFARLLAVILCALRGRRAPGQVFDKMVFKTYNKHFEPNRTEFDWLSRDELEVDRYIHDPKCGSLSSYALWRELFGGLLNISTREALRKAPDELPILITGGELDPVGGRAALERLAAEYRTTDHSDVTLKLYPEGRHEMLNETNRDAVTKDWLDWIDAVVARAPQGTQAVR